MGYRLPPPAIEPEPESHVSATASSHRSRWMDEEDSPREPRRSSSASGAYVAQSEIRLERSQSREGQPVLPKPKSEPMDEERPTSEVRTLSRGVGSRQGREMARPTTSPHSDARSASRDYTVIERERKKKEKYDRRKAIASFHVLSSREKSSAPAVQSKAKPLSRPVQRPVSRPPSSMPSQGVYNALPRPLTAVKQEDAQTLHPFEQARIADENRRKRQQRDASMAARTLSTIRPRATSAASRGPEIRPRTSPPAPLARHVNQDPNIHRVYPTSLPLYPGAKSVEPTKRIYNWKQDKESIDRLFSNKQEGSESFVSVVNDTVSHLVYLDLGLGTRSVFDRVSIQAENPDLSADIDPIAKSNSCCDRVILADHGFQHGLVNHAQENWVNCNDGRVEGRNSPNWLNRSHYIRSQTRLHNQRLVERNETQRNGLKKMENPYIEKFLKKGQSCIGRCL